MAFYCGFYNAVKHDRQYDAQDFGEMFDGLIRDGVYATIGNAMAVKPGGGMRVIVQTGRAWFNHTWSVNTADYPLDIPDSDLLLPRTDAIILEIDKRVSVRNNSLKVVQGYPATDPLPPDLIRDAGQSIYQYPLAYITVPANAVTIDKSMIDNRIGREPTPFVTGIVQSISIDDAWMQWEGQFENWFNNLKDELSENVVTDLLLKLERKVDKADKATIDDIIAGTKDKWIGSDVFAPYIASNVHQIGDVFKSTKNLESDSVMLCDGRTLEAAQYPKLWDAMGRGGVISTKNKQNFNYMYDTGVDSASTIVRNVAIKDSKNYIFNRGVLSGGMYPLNLVICSNGVMKTLDLASSQGYYLDSRVPNNSLGFYMGGYWFVYVIKNNTYPLIKINAANPSSWTVQNSELSGYTSSYGCLYGNTYYQLDCLITSSTNATYKFVLRSVTSSGNYSESTIETSVLNNAGRPTMLPIVPYIYVLDENERRPLKRLNLQTQGMEVVPSAVSNTILEKISPLVQYTTPINTKGKYTMLEHGLVAWHDGGEKLNVLDARPYIINSFFKSSSSVNIASLVSINGYPSTLTLDDLIFLGNGSRGYIVLNKSFKRVFDTAEAAVNTLAFVWIDRYSSLYTPRICYDLTENALHSVSLFEDNRNNLGPYHFKIWSTKIPITNQIVLPNYSTFCDILSRYSTPLNLVTSDLTHNAWTYIRVK